MRDRKVLIVGGTGSWGHELIKQLLDMNVAQIRVFARSESQMVALKHKFTSDKVVPVIGDIKDKSRLMVACKEVDTVFHLAALKHVPICETMPTEAILTNVIGTQNVIECAISSGVQRMIYASTDKAVTPSCTYGCTKLLGEKLMQSAAENSGQTKLITFRSGNLLGSMGSVVPLFQKQIEESRRVNLTDEQMNRFFISIPEAARLLIEATITGQGGEIFIPEIPSLRIYDIAKYLLKKQGFDETHIRITGLRPGERLNESMATEDEAKMLYRMGKGLRVISKDYSPSKHTGSGIGHGYGQGHGEHYHYRSQDAVMDYEEAERFLNRAGLWEAN